MVSLVVKIISQNFLNQCMQLYKLKVTYHQLSLMTAVYKAEA